MAWHLETELSQHMSTTSASYFAFAIMHAGFLFIIIIIIIIIFIIYSCPYLFNYKWHAECTLD